MYALAAEEFAELVGRIPGNAWTGPGLGEWDLRSLVGHTTRSLITVDTYLDRPTETEVVASPDDYYRATHTVANADPAAVTERGRQAGLALGDDPVAAVRLLIDRVMPRIYAVDDPLIETIAGGMRLSTYLPTRIFELVVHSLDIARAADLDPQLPPALLQLVAGLAARAAVAQGDGTVVIDALTGRSSLPPGFSVV
ncbi:MAG: maleylpyruvate isomerase N-terminal domain-containing protein [Propionibacteriaceae bacterium]